MICHLLSGGYLSLLHCSNMYQHKSWLCFSHSMMWTTAEPILICFGIKDGLKPTNDVTCVVMAAPGPRANLWILSGKWSHACGCGMPPKRRTKAPLCSCGCLKKVPASRTRSGQSWRVRVLQKYVVFYNTHEHVMEERHSSSASRSHGRCWLERHCGWCRTGFGGVVRHKDIHFNVLLRRNWLGSLGPYGDTWRYFLLDSWVLSKPF